MLEVFCLLIGCTIISVLYERAEDVRIIDHENQIKYDNWQSRILFALLCIVLILFSGLRTRMNDTATYLSNFSNKIPVGISAIKDMDWDIGSNPLFNIYQILIKTFISDNGSVFILITALIVQISYLMYIKKYAYKFSYTVYLFISFTVYAFSLAAMKQTFAIAIGIWAIPLFLNNKKILSIILILLASLIHPYVVIYFAAYFLSKNIWDKRTVFIIVVTLIAGASFSTLVGGLMEAASSIGDTYSEEMLTEGNVNIFRFLVYLVVPIMSFICRKRLEQTGDRMVFTVVNLSVLSSCFMMLARLGGANLFGRMANYFDIFQCLALPVVVEYGFKNSKYKNIIKYLSIIGFAIFYYTYYSKYSSLGSCFYDHTSLFEILRNW